MWLCWIAHIVFAVFLRGVTTQHKALLYKNERMWRVWYMTGTISKCHINVIYTSNERKMGKKWMRKICDRDRYHIVVWVVCVFYDTTISVLNSADDECRLSRICGPNATGYIKLTATKDRKWIKWDPVRRLFIAMVKCNYIGGNSLLCV